jgi:serine phosphatase RsbU (regulator of sigma subunit)
MNPAKEVGGDFYDFFLIDEKHLGVVMADVSGKGVPAALFMMVSKILIQNIAMMGNSPAEVLKFVNGQLCSNNPEEMFVTVWYGCLDLDTGTLKAANAGHEYPVLKSSDGTFELIKDKHGLVLGGMEGADYKEYELKMEPGSKLFIYTDGIPEATNSNVELFGTERLVHALRMAEKRSPQEIIEHVNSIVKDFVKEAPQFDDLTMLCLEYLGPKESKK